MKSQRKSQRRKAPGKAASRKAPPKAARRPGRAAAQDAVALLKADHRKVEGLFKKAEKAKGGAKEKLVEQIRAMVAALENAAREHGASVRVEVIHKYDAYRLADDAPIVQQAVALLRDLGVEPLLEISGGGSDVNIFARRGLNVANLSVGYRAIHSTEEHIAIADLVRSAELVARSIMLNDER